MLLIKHAINKHLREVQTMTLFKGCHVVKLDPDGQPLMDPQREVHVEYKIVELATTPAEWDQDNKIVQPRVFALLEKVR